jgi:hypothetical protein
LYIEDLRDQARIGVFIKRKTLIAITTCVDGYKPGHSQGESQMNWDEFNTAAAELAEFSPTPRQLNRPALSEIL